MGRPKTAATANDLSWRATAAWSPVMADQAALLRVLGWPCLQDPLPVNGSPCGLATRLAIQGEVLRATGVRGWVRSPTVLWVALRGGVPPLGPLGAPLLMEWGFHNWCTLCRRPLLGRDYVWLLGTLDGWSRDATKVRPSGSVYDAGWTLGGLWP